MMQEKKPLELGWKVTNRDMTQMSILQVTDEHITGYIRQLEEVTDAEGVDLDTEFELNGLVRLYELYKYWARHARADLPNPTQMDIHAGELVRELTKYRSRIRQYKEFCENEADQLPE